MDQSFSTTCYLVPSKKWPYKKSSEAFVSNSAKTKHVASWEASFAIVSVEEHHNDEPDHVGREDEHDEEDKPGGVDAEPAGQLLSHLGCLIFSHASCVE